MSVVVIINFVWNTHNNDKNDSRQNVPNFNDIHLNTKVNALSI